MHTFLVILQKGGKYYAYMARHQVEFRREDKFIDQKLLSISALQIYYLNVESLVINNEGSNSYPSK